MTTRAIEDVYALTPMQRGMLFHALGQSDSDPYFVQLDCMLRGRLDADAFERAWQCVIGQQPVLRTAFFWEGLDEPCQVVYRSADFSIEKLDWTDCDAAERSRRFAVLLAEDRRFGIDLTQPPLMRIRLARLSEDTWQFLWAHHHIVLDGWSLPLLFRQLFDSYEAFSQGRQPRLESAPPFRSYVAWLQQQSTGAAQNYWRSRLGGFASATPVDGAGESRKQSPDAERAMVERKLPERVGLALEELGRRHGITLNTFLQGAWAILLSRYSRSRDVLFGATVSGRPHTLPGAERIVGLFINTVPVRVDVDPAQSSLDWLRALQAEQLSAREYEYASLVDIQGWSDVPRGEPLFESLVVFENYPVESVAAESAGSLRVERLHSEEGTNYPLTLVSGPGTELRIAISFDAGRFSRTRIERMLDHLSALLEGFAADTGKTVGEIRMLSDAELQRMTVEWNRTEVAVPEDPFPRLFQRRAASDPDAAAIVFGDRSLSYGELEARANQLARRLRALGIRPESLVGVCLERSEWIAVALLGILKAGGAYLPLDPRYPAERLRAMVEDARPKLVLTQAGLAGVVQPLGAPSLCIDSEWPSIASEQPTPPETDPAPGNLAYVIYTSGSTGRPKGVMITHAGLTSLCAGDASRFAIQGGTSVLQFASLSFDASVLEIFVPLAHGGTVHFVGRDDAIDLPRLRALLRESRIAFASLPPSLWKLLDPEGLPDLKIVIAAAERCPREVAERWSPGRTFINGYGPTETTVCACLAHSPAEVEPPPPIGRPSANKRVYILDHDLQPVPVGVAGELCIAGAGLARGYLDRPEATAEKFVPDPFGEPGSRMYRSGDLASYREHGNIDFHGRIDEQVKIRGFRIEPGEIEAVLERHPAVSRAAVVVRTEAGDPYLAAYYVAASETADEELRRYLERELPSHMIPAAWLALEAMPLLPNGKLNRRALPAPDSVSRSAEFIAPRTPMEDLLAGMWADVLRLGRVGRDANFFELGGHSLSAAQLMSRMPETLGRAIPLRELFDHPTVAGLAARLDQLLAVSAGVEETPFERLPAGEAPPLSFAQERLWFLDQLEPGSSFYNNQALVRMRGRLNAAVLEDALNEVVRRHDALRTGFCAVEGVPAVFVAAELRVPLPVSGGEIWDAARLEGALPFDLSRPPLMRARLWKVADDEHVLLLLMHHIVCDGWSAGIFVSELAAIYSAFAAGRCSALPELAFQYGDFARWQRRWLQGPNLESQVAYWKKQLDGLPPLLELPADRPRPPVQSFRGAEYPFEFGPELAARLRALARSENATLFMVLLAGFDALLARYTRQHAIAVGTAIAGRNRVEIEPLIGFFVNTLVLRTDVSGDPSFRELLARVRETALGAYAHADLPFEMLVSAIAPERNLSHSPLFQVMLTLNGTPARPAEFPGLELELLRNEARTSRFDLTLEFTDAGDCLAGSAEYSTDLFEETTVARMVAHLGMLLEAAAADPEEHVSRLPMLSAAEQEALTSACNRTEAPFPSASLIHELFEKHAKERPEGIALQCGGRELTYAELDRRANRLARHFERRGVGPEAIVGLLLEPSVEFVVALLGVLKAGGAYLPLDLGYPAERLEFMLRDSGASAIVTAGSPVAARVSSAYSGEQVRLDEDWPEIEREPDSAPQSTADPENLAYVIYTSGSTGQPKGVLLRHRGLCNLATEQARLFHLGPASRVLQFAPLSFDAAVWETFMALASGGTLYIAPQQRAAMDELHEFLRASGITNVTLPPSVLAALSSEGLPVLDTVIAAGEACGSQLVEKWAPGRRFFNAYGPTETTVCASAALCSDSAAGDPPIGTPLANTQLYVLDDQLEPVPSGVPGELYIGGAGLARGYLGQPEKTADRFLPDPFGGNPGARLYRTGDLVRRRSDGQVEFLGRIDHQTKIRGYRIEPGEIEAALAHIEGVREAAVVARSQQLLAYVAGPDVPGAAELRAVLRCSLPEYMVPARFEVLPALPRNPSGKVDRRLLPDTDRLPDRLRPPVSPRTETERLLAAIWKDVLDGAEPGVEDNFFEIGGHSLLATQVVSRMRQTFHIEIALRAIFEYPILESLAKHVEEAQAAGAPPPEPALVAIPREQRRLKRSAAAE